MEAITRDIAETCGKISEFHISKDINVKGITDSFDNMKVSMDKVGFENEFKLNEITREGGTDIEMTNIKTGKVIDHVEILKSLEVGDIMKVWEDMGIPDDLLKSPDAVKYAASEKVNYLESPYGKTREALADSTKSGKALTKELGDVKTEDAIVKDGKLTKNGEFLEKQSEGIEKSLKDEAVKDPSKLDTVDENGNVKQGKGFEYGKFVKSTIYYGLTGLTALMIYGWIKDHQDKMSGCWLIKKQDGTKCKLHNLSCGDSKTKGELCDGKIPSTCGEGSDECFSDKSCVFWDKDVNGNNTSCKTTLSEVSNCDNNCSTYCNSSMIECPEGYSLLCVNADFWDAAADFIEAPLNVGGDIISKLTNILKYILYGALIIFGLIILFKVGMVILSKINKKTQEKNTPP